jgi:hypothetical protein
MRRSSLMTLVVTVWLASAMGACDGGKSAPTAPSPTPPPVTNPTPGAGSTSVTVTAVSLENNQPLSAVTVTAGTLSATTDANGTATFNEAIPAGARLTFEKAGFRKRENVLFRGSGMQELLMPMGGELSDEVFRGFAFAGGNTTVKLRAGTNACIVPTPDLQGSEPMQILREGIAWVTALPGLGESGVSFALTTSPDSSCFVIPARIDPDATAGGEAEFLFGMDGYLERGAIKFRSIGNMAPIVVAHEIGHVLGFGHIRVKGVMSETDISGVTGFTYAERLSAKFTFVREPLTTWEDRAPQ